MKEINEDKLKENIKSKKVDKLQNIVIILIVILALCFCAMVYIVNRWFMKEDISEKGSKFEIVSDKVHEILDEISNSIMKMDDDADKIYAISTISLYACKSSVELLNLGCGKHVVDFYKNKMRRIINELDDGDLWKHTQEERNDGR